MEALGEFKFNSEKFPDDAKSKCIICQGEFEDDIEVSLMPKCRHMLHSECC